MLHHSIPNCVILRCNYYNVLLVLQFLALTNFMPENSIMLHCIIYTVSQKKTSHFNFRHNFAICWDIFTIFEAPCSGLIAGWCNLLYTHHRCEAFTWRDITHDVIQAVARSAHWHRISYHLTYGVWTHRTYILLTFLFGVSCKRKCTRHT